LATALALIAGAVFGDNTTSTVDQVSVAVTLNSDVDYHISSTEPFTATGSVDIANTNHAVLIFDNLKPSLAIQQLGFVTINGEAAKNNSNCQVRIYGSGSMVLPYINNNVLTVYSEKGLAGDSCSNFDLRNSGGYMNTLTTDQLNDRIMSFRLKRGYMVTFSLKAGGKGYSRCFIAANGDLEVDLPKLMQKRISSYRLFKWNDVGKKGLANNTGSEYNSALNTQWCYSFGLGESAGVDRECVPHKIYGSWPSTTACGEVTYSPHLKTSNEPANSSDDTPETVATVLNYWEDLMATGLRLCSPSQHDGGLSWTRAFMDSIDARGWRCDIVDIHCYWPEWNLLNQVDGYYSSYKRPIWISEWLWGASWNKNGVFASSDPDNDNATVLKGVLNKWNSSKYVERYAYWNSESKGHLYDGGGITAAGKVYRDSNTGLGYDSSIEFVPKAPRMENPSNFTLSFTPTSMVATLKWKDENGELLDSMFVERQKDGGEWERIATVDDFKTNTSFSVRDTLNTGGTYLYRIHTIAYNGTSRYSSELQNMLTSSNTLGDGNLQYGTLKTTDTELAYTYLAQPLNGDDVAVAFGSVSNFQSDAALSERVFRVFKSSGSYKFFRSSLTAWTDYKETGFYKYVTGTSDYGEEFTSYILAPVGVGKIGSLSYEAQVLDEMKVGDSVSVTFSAPFTKNPVVLVSPKYTTSIVPVVVRVYDVTPTGCKVKLMSQKSQSSTVRYAEVELLAIEQGTTTDDKGKQITVTADDYSFKTTSLTKLLTFDEAYTNPTFLAQLQSKNREVAAILRTRPNYVDSLTLRLRFQIDTSDTGNTTVNASNPINETIGWIVISDDKSYDGIADVKRGTVSTKETAVYDLQGRKMNAERGNLPKGIYIVNGRKVVIR